MSLSIQSDGTPINTKVFYNGKDITDQITSVDWSIAAHQPGTAMINFRNVSFMLDSDTNVRIQVGNVRVNYQMPNMRQAVRCLWTLLGRSKRLPRVQSLGA